MRLNKTSRIGATGAVLVAVALGSTPAQAAEPSGDWYHGWQFQRKSVCIESNIPNAPLAAIASMYRVYGIKVYVRFALGQCAAAGFPRSQYVPVTAYKEDNNMCAGAPTYHVNGYVTAASVIINMQPDTKQPDGSTRYYSTCRSGQEWQDQFAHELGHTFGLTHDQPARSSIMRDGHTTDKYDQWRLNVTYQNNPY
jgi:hypothetical protein